MIQWVSYPGIRTVLHDTFAVNGCWRSVGRHPTALGRLSNRFRRVYVVNTRRGFVAERLLCHTTSVSTKDLFGFNSRTQNFLRSYPFRALQVARTRRREHNVHNSSDSSDPTGRAEIVYTYSRLTLYCTKPWSYERRRQSLRTFSSGTFQTHCVCNIDGKTCGECSRNFAPRNWKSDVDFAYDFNSKYVRKKLKRKPTVRLYFTTVPVTSVGAPFSQFFTSSSPLQLARMWIWKSVSQIIIIIFFYR